MNLRASLPSALLLMLAACGPSTPAAAPDPVASAAPSAEPAAPPAPSAEPAADKPAPAADKPAETSPEEALARDLVKSSGRRIGYSAAKKRFVVPIEMRANGGRGLDIRFYDDEGNQKENQRVCQPGECEERLNEIAKELIPKLATRLKDEGYEALYAVGWPEGRDELDVTTMNLKLRYQKGKLSLAREKKPAAPLRALGKAPKAEALSAVYPVPAAKLVAAFAPGDGVAQEFFLFKLP